MGCGASKDASANAPAEPEKKGKKGHGEGKDAAFDTGAVDAAAAVTTAVGTAAVVAGAVNDGARSAMGEVAGAAGNALLAFGKELPWVAPIAFLVAGVVQASADVHALKHDAKIFCANVRSVENVMAEAGRKGHLAKVEETCMALQYEMEEGLAFCHKLKTQYFITQMVMSGRHCQKFKDISDSIHRQVTIIAAAASIDTHDIVRSEFEQGKKLQAKIAELGGADAVAADPALKAQCREFLSASDAMIVSAVDEVQRAVELAESRSQKKMDEMMTQSRLQTKVLEDQVANLTKMMEVLLNTRVGLADAGVDLSQADGRRKAAAGEENPPPAPDAAALDATAEEQISGDAVRDVLKRMPVSSTEAERLAVVENLGLNTEDVTDLIGDGDLKEIVDEGREALGMTDCYIGSIDASRQTYLSYCAKDAEGAELPRGDGFWWPNITSACKHVVKKGDVLHSNGSIAENRMSNMDNLSLPEYQALAEAGHDECKNVFPVIGAVMADPDGKIPHETLMKQEYQPHGEKDTTYGAARTFFGATLMAKELHYSGAPIKVDGQTVATFCVFDRRGTRDDVDAQKMRDFADKAAKVFQEKAKARGFKA